MKTFTHELSRFLWQQIVVSLVISSAILAEQIHLGVISREAIHTNLIAFVNPYLYVFLGLVLWHILRTSYVLYGEQQAEITKLQNTLGATQVELTNSQSVRPAQNLVTSFEWRELAEKFGKSSFPIRAQYQLTRGVVTWNLHDPKFRSLCVLAGSMLMKSPNLTPTLSSELLSESSPLSRWLNYVKEVKGASDISYGIEELDDGTKLVHWLGSISDVGQTSANLCIECSAKEV